MQEDNQEILHELFKYNLAQTAFLFGLTDKKPDLFDIKHATQLLNYAEKLSNRSGDSDKLKSFLICTLLWENRQPEWQALKAYLPRILIKIGLTTSAKMIGHNPQSNVFSALGSYIEELYSTATILSHEVLVHDKTLVLSSFQKRMWDSIDQYNRVGISAPTSAGKSYVLINKVIDILSKAPGKVVFIVPTISLINQVCNDFRKKFKEYGITDISVSQTVNNHSLFKGEKTIYVLTQERALGALNHTEGDLDDIKMLIIDEIQNVEKVSSEDDERSKTLFDAIQELKNDKKPEKIIVSGPRLANITAIVKELFGEQGASVSEDIPPVLNISYSFRKKNRSQNTIFFTQHLPLGYETSIEIEDKYLLKDKILGKKLYGTEMYDFIAKLVSCDSKSGNIVFAGKTSQATSTALEIAKRIPADNEMDLDLLSLQSFIAETVHIDYSLISVVGKRIGYHHSRMPQHIRNIVEKAFTKRHLNTIVSTTTLMQGINLPAKNIIIRNPSVGKHENLTGYEFTNLKGRAGRLMQDLVGRAIIIDELECQDKQINLNLQDEKNLNIGYADRFNRGRSSIENALTNNLPISDNTTLGSDIVVYIRNMALKYGASGYIRLNEVGVSINYTQYEKVLEDLSNLKIPKQICFSNFYWDPLILDQIYQSFLRKEWPKIPNKIYDCSNQIYDLIAKISEFSPGYYKKYFDIQIDPIGRGGRALSMCIFAEGWGQGKPIKDVINPSNWPIKNSTDIDERISALHNKVMYGLPKLLRPLFQINDMLYETNTTHLLSYIEIGAFDPKLRTLIEIGVPRETAISFLSEVSPSNFLSEEGNINDRELKNYISRVKSHPNVNPWHKILIEDL